VEWSESTYRAALDNKQEAVLEYLRDNGCPIPNGAI
jgi:hypothetical protein